MDPGGYHLAHLVHWRRQVAVHAGPRCMAIGAIASRAGKVENISWPDLARAALLEAGRLARSGTLSAEGRKKIKYGTRSLSILPKEIKS